MTGIKWKRIAWFFLGFLTSFIFFIGSAIFFNEVIIIPVFNITGWMNNMLMWIITAVIIYASIIAAKGVSKEFTIDRKKKLKGTK